MRHRPPRPAEQRPTLPEPTESKPGRPAAAEAPGAPIGLIPPPISELLLQPNETQQPAARPISPPPAGSAGPPASDYIEPPPALH
jgi:hypothetical protein